MSKLSRRLCGGICEARTKEETLLEAIGGALEAIRLEDARGWFSATAATL